MNYADHYPNEITGENLTEEDLILVTDISRAIFDAWLKGHH